MTTETSFNLLEAEFYSFECIILSFLSILDILRVLKVGIELLIELSDISSIMYLNTGGSSIGSRWIVDFSFSSAFGSTFYFDLLRGLIMGILGI